MRVLTESVWPRGGWTRAFHYVKHRVRRLPDDPHRIARGVGAGVFVSFTPLFGFHFLTAAGTALLVRGNVLAALLATFFGNPITFPIIAYSSMKLGHWMLGTRFDPAHQEGLMRKFIAASGDLQHNFFAMFTDATAHWGGLARFFYEVFLPYLVGGFIPGVIAGLISYYLSAPIIVAYQKRRRRRITERLGQLKAKLHAKLEERAERKNQDPQD
ncbi:DUF2062 domain-containing protein [Phaeovulum sp.]|uniref:DUF2062 domain-containing protein n=1 Tax=Phaeovulum sp. TaxID=2934796 RepID=UPI0039E6A031